MDVETRRQCACAHFIDALQNNALSVMLLSLTHVGLEAEPATVEKHVFLTSFGNMCHQICTCLQHLDKLAREEAFFPGPLPMLLTALKLDDLAILLGGSDRASSQVSSLAPATQLVMC